jgi:hypothetical protein
VPQAKRRTSAKNRVDLIGGCRVLDAVLKVSLTMSSRACWRCCRVLDDAADVSRDLGEEKKKREQ